MSEVFNLEAVRSRDLDEAATLQRIRRYISEAPENSRIFTITPMVATYLLEKYNIKNRPQKPSKISEYTAHIAADDWWLTGDTIKFSDMGILRDGQNRLMACIRSGKSFRTHVVFGIPDGAFAVIDRGKNRDGSDVLMISGYQNTTNLAAAIRWAWLFEQKRVKSRDSIEPQEQLRLVRECYPDLPKFVTKASAIYQICDQPVGFTAGFLYTIHRLNLSAAEAFAQAWATGMHKGRFAAIGKMQVAIVAKKQNTATRLNEVWRAAIVVKAWNSYREQRAPVKADFVWELNDEFPEIFG